jgi:hypothetical protein
MVELQQAFLPGFLSPYLSVVSTFCTKSAGMLTVKMWSAPRAQ